MAHHTSSIEAGKKVEQGASEVVHKKVVICDEPNTAAQTKGFVSLLGNMSTPLLGEKKKTVAERMTVATTDARMVMAALELRNRRASRVMADLRSKRITVATSDARLMEQRRDALMVDEFMKMASVSREIEEGMSNRISLKKVGEQVNSSISTFLRRKPILETKEEAIEGKPVEDDDDDDDDDEAEGQTNSEIVLNMLNNALSTGLLALPCTMMKSGLIVGIGIQVVSALLNNFTLLTHVKTCRIAKCNAAGATLGEVAMGRPGFYFITFAYFIMGFLGMVGYVNVSATAMQKLLGHFFPSLNDIDELTFKVVNWALVLVPGCFIRKLDGIAVMSLVSCIGALLVLLTVLIRCGGGLVFEGLPAMEEIQWYPVDLDRLLAATPVWIFMYSLQTGGGIIISGAKDNTPENQTKVCSISFLCVFLLYVVVSLVGYLYFLNKTPSVILEAFPTSDVLVNFGRVGVLFFCPCGYVMRNVPTRLTIMQLLFKKNVDEVSGMQFLGVNACISIACLLAGMMFTDIAFLFGLCGSVVTPWISFIVPAVFGILVRAKADDPAAEAPILSWKNWDLFGVLALGLILWVIFNFGLVLSISGLAITDDFKIVTAMTTPSP